MAPLIISGGGPGPPNKITYTCKCCSTETLCIAFWLTTLIITVHRVQQPGELHRNERRKKFFGQ